jgi:hypothetical protein
MNRSSLLILCAIALHACSQKRENSYENIAFQEGDLVFREGLGAKIKTENGNCLWTNKLDDNGSR